MSFQNQRNVFGGLGQGLARAAEAVAGFFSRRAEQQYQEGVSRISEAKTKLQDYEAIARHPDAAAEISPEEQAVLNAGREILGRIANARPQEARALWEEYLRFEETGGRVISNITRRTRSATRGQPAGAVGRQGAAGQTVQGGTAVGSTTERRVDVTPVSETLDVLSRRLGLAERRREDEVTAGERDFILLRDAQGREHEIQMADLQRLANLELQARDAANTAERDARLNEYNTLLRELDHKYGLENGAVEQMYAKERIRIQGDVEADLIRARADTELSVQDQLAVRAAIQDEWATLKDDTLDADIRRAALENIRDWRSMIPNGDTRYSDSILTRNLEATDELRREAAVSQLEADALVDDFARAQLETQQTANTQAKLNLNATFLTMRGQELLNEQIAAENRIRTSTDARATLSDLVAMGNTSAVQAMLEEKRNPGSFPEYSNIVEALSLPELEKSVGLAERADNERSTESEYTLARLERAINQEGMLDLVDRAQLIDTVAATYDADTIADNPRIQQLVQEGKLNRADVAAMESRARLRGVVEREQVNGPKISRAMSRLNMYSASRPDPKDPEAVSAAVTGVETALLDLVALDAMAEEDVAGIVALFRQAWSDQGTKFDLDNALTQSEIAVNEALARKYAAETNILNNPGPGSMIPEDMRLAMKDAFELELENLKAEYPQCADVLTTAELASSQQRGDCGEYEAKVRDLRDRQGQQYWDIYGIATNSRVLQQANVEAEYERASDAWGQDAADAYFASVTMKAEAEAAGLQIPPDFIFEPTSDETAAEEGAAWQAKYGDSQEAVWRSINQYNQDIAEGVELGQEDVPRTAEAAGRAAGGRFWEGMQDAATFVYSTAPRAVGDWATGVGRYAVNFVAGIFSGNPGDIEGPNGTRLPAGVNLATMRQHVSNLSEYKDNPYSGTGIGLAASVANRYGFDMSELRSRYPDEPSDAARVLRELATKYGAE